MAFQAPRIIGGGQIQKPSTEYVNPWDVGKKFREDERAAGQKQELIDLQRQQQYFQEFDPTSTEQIDQYMEHYGKDNKGGGGGLLGMVKGIFSGKGGSQQTSGLPFDPDNPESIKKYQSEQGLTVDGVAGPKTMSQVSQTSFQAPDRPTPLNPDYEEEEQWEGRPSPKLGGLERAGNWMKENVFNKKGFEGGGGDTGVKTGVSQIPEDKGSYQNMLNAGTAQKRDPYGYGNTQEDTGGSPKENIFTKAKDFITRPSNRKYESATEEGREMVKNLDLSDNDAVARFQEVMGMEADGIAGKNTIAAIRALQSGEHERATSGYRPDMQITGIGKQRGGYSLVGGGDLPGKRTGDKNSAMLEDGEYVLNRNAVKAIGKGYLDYINDERYPRFQSGGHVPGYQFGGGFEAPDEVGATAQMVQPTAGDNFDEVFGGLGGGGGGETPSLGGDAAKEATGMSGEAVAGIAENPEALAGIAKMAPMLMSMFSDQRLKKDINRVGNSPSGIPIFEFTFRNDPDERRYRGTIANNMPDHPAVTKNKNGLYKIDYSQIDVDFEEVAPQGYQEGGDVDPYESIRPATPSGGTMNLVNEVLGGDFDAYNRGESLPDQGYTGPPVADRNYDEQVNIQDIVKMQGNKVNQYVDPSAGWERKGFQEGGTVRRPTGYQTGGGFSLPMAHQYQGTQSRIEDEDRLRRRQEIMGEIGQSSVQSAADVNTYNKEIEEQVKRQQGNVGGYLDYAFDYMMPEFLEKPMMGITRGVQQFTGISDKPGEEDWFTGVHIPKGDLPSSFYDARRAGGERQMDKYETEQQETFQKSALQRAGQDPGVLNPEDYSYIQGITSTPSPNPYAGMSNRAMKRLYKEAIQEEGNNPMDLMKQLYGDEWWKAQSQ